MNRILPISGCLSIVVIWLAVLPVTGFNPPAAGSDLLGAVYPMGRS